MIMNFNDYIYKSEYYFSVDPQVGDIFLNAPVSMTKPFTFSGQAAFQSSTQIQLIDIYKDNILYIRTYNQGTGLFTSWITISGGGTGSTNITIDVIGNIIDVNSSTGTGAVFPLATTTTAGALSSDGKTYIDSLPVTLNSKADVSALPVIGSTIIKSLAAGSNVTLTQVSSGNFTINATGGGGGGISTISSNTLTVTPSGSNVDIELPISTTTILGGVKPDGTTIVANSQGVITAQSGAGTNLGVSVTGNIINLTSSTGTGASFPLATTLAAGAFSKEDKDYIDGLPAELDDKANVTDLATIGGIPIKTLNAGTNVTINETSTGNFNINSSGGGGGASVLVPTIMPIPTSQISLSEQNNWVYFQSGSASITTVTLQLQNALTSYNDVSVLITNYTKVTFNLQVFNGITQLSMAVPNQGTSTSYTMKPFTYAYFSFNSSRTYGVLEFEGSGAEMLYGNLTPVTVASDFELRAGQNLYCNITTNTGTFIALANSNTGDTLNLYNASVNALTMTVYRDAAHTTQYNFVLPDQTQLPTYTVPARQGWVQLNINKSTNQVYVLPYYSTGGGSAGITDIQSATLNVSIGSNIATINLPIATTNKLGGVKPDGTSITVDSQGVIAAAAVNVIAPQLLDLPMAGEIDINKAEQWLFFNTGQQSINAATLQLKNAFANYNKVSVIITNYTNVTFSLNVKNNLTVMYMLSPAQGQVSAYSMPPYSYMSVTFDKTVVFGEVEYESVSSSSFYSYISYLFSATNFNLRSGQNLYCDIASGSGTFLTINCPKNYGTVNIYNVDPVPLVITAYYSITHEQQMTFVLPDQSTSSTYTVPSRQGWVQLYVDNANFKIYVLNHKASVNTSSDSMQIDMPIGSHISFSVSSGNTLLNEAKDIYVNDAGTGYQFTTTANKLLGTWRCSGNAGAMVLFRRVD